MKVAVASSGLGHVARGIETWALDTAEALQARRLDVTLFAGGQTVDGGHCPLIILPCWRRGDALAQRLARWSPGVAWRWGMKAPYGWEQFSFWMRLWPHLRRGQFDILHVQDPMLAYWCRWFRRLGILKTREILAHGTEEPVEFLRQFDFVQHLAPWHLSSAECGIRSAESGIQKAQLGMRKAEGSPKTANSSLRVPHSALEKPFWAAIPNFVDTDVFRPPRDSEEKRGCRAGLGIPETALVIGTVAAVKKHHKRIDYLIREFAEYNQEPAAPFLLIAGARTVESAELAELAQQLNGGQIRILLDLPRGRMPELYRCMDVFVLTSLFEMMPIAMLEAMASGLPVIANRHPVLEWMTGDGQPAPAGRCIDMKLDGALAQALAALRPEWILENGQRARDRALRLFSKDAVIGQYISYYEQVLGLKAVDGAELRNLR